MTKIQMLREELNMTRTVLAKKTGLRVKDIKEAEELKEMYISEVNSIAKALKVRPSSISVIYTHGCFAREKRR